MRTKAIVVTLAVFHAAMFWLKADAESNICEPHRTMTQQAPNQRDMSRSMPAERRHAPAESTQGSRPRGAAKADEPACRHAMATSSTVDIVETRAVFQPPMSWLKADAELNTCEPHR